MSFQDSTPFLQAREVGWELIRQDFPILQREVNGHPLVYLDNAATSQKPTSVIEAMDGYYQRINANVHRGLHELSNRATEAYEAGRSKAAKFVGAQSEDEIVFTRGTTESINLVASTWGSTNLRKGDVILLTEMEHHSNLVPWQLLCERTGARLRFIPVMGDEGSLDLDRFDELLKDGVKLLAMTHISNSLGTINPVAELCSRAREKGVTTLVDAAQSAGHMLIDVKSIGCDFLALSGHKICGPTGIGVLYGRKELLNAMPPYQGGGEMIQSVEYEHSTFNSGAQKFEAGTPNIAGVIGLSAAMDYLDSIGREIIFEHDSQLAEVAFHLLSQIEGIRIFGPKGKRAGIVSFELPDVHAHDIVTFADQKGIALRGGHHCNQPLMKKLGVSSTARASFYFYNSISEIEFLVQVVRGIRDYFSRPSKKAVG